MSQGSNTVYRKGRKGRKGQNQPTIMVGELGDGDVSFLASKLRVHT